MRLISHNGERKSLRQWAGEMGVNYGTVKYRWQIGIRDFDMLFQGGDPSSPDGLTQDDVEWLNFTRKARRGMKNEWELACELVGLSKYQAPALKAYMEGMT